MDIERHLKNEPVVARPPSKFYRLQKSLRRNKLAYTAAGAVVAALIVGLGVSAWESYREREARRRAMAAEQEQTRLRLVAETKERKSEQVARFLKSMLEGVGPSVALGRDTTMLREILDRTEKRVGEDLKDQPEVEAELRNTLGEVYLALGQYQKAEMQQ